MRGKKRIFSELAKPVDEKTEITWELLIDIRDLLRNLVNNKEEHGKKK